MKGGLKDAHTANTGDSYHIPQPSPSNLALLERVIATLNHVMVKGSCREYYCG